MNAKDIKVGDEYAYRRNTWSQSRRVRVNGATVISRSGHSPKPVRGWEVEFLDDHPGGYLAEEKGRTINVTSRQITMPWADFQHNQDAKRQSEESYQAQVDAARSEQDMAVAAIREMGLDFQAARVMTFKATQLLDLLRQVEANSVATAG